MSVNFMREMEKLIAGFAPGERPGLLLHVCCAPCACGVLPLLMEHFDITVLFYNPNIRPKEEYEKRLYWLRYLLERLPGGENVELIDPGWRQEDFLRAAKGLEHEPEGGVRCTECFYLRLGETARRAVGGGFDFFCTTLSVSPRKDAALINLLGARFAEGCGVRWLPSDFKKKDGWLHAVTLAKELGLYRQHYCGCTPRENGEQQTAKSLVSAV